MNGRVLATAALIALAAPGSAFAHGDEVPISQLTRAWEPDPVVLGLAALVLALFAQAFVRLRRRGRADHAPWSRVPLMLGAVALGTLPLVSPLDAVGDHYLLSFHMLEHVLIGDAAPAVALVALRGPLLFFLVPPFALRPLARMRPLRATLSWLLRPRVALVAWAIVISCWHWPTAYDFTLTHENVHKFEHLCFVIVGVLVWTQLVDPARRHALSLVHRLGYAATLFVLGMALSDVLVFSFRPLYPSYAGQDERLFGFTPLLDQQLAGVVMMREQLLTLGICGAFLLRAYLRRDRIRVPGKAVEAAR